MKLLIELPEYNVKARAILYTDHAPERCALIWEALEKPFETKTRHAIFEGYEIYCFLPQPKKPPLENQTMRPKPGDLISFFLGKRDFACMHWGMFASEDLFELAFVYGENDLRYFYEEGQRASLVGKIIEGFDEFAEACGRTITEGQTTLRISQDVE